MGKHTAASKNERPEDVFGDIFHGHKWGPHDSVSGPGSTLQGSAELRAQLPALLAELQVKTFLDVPCGDFYWMRTVNLSNIRYIGGDIVPSLIAQNQTQYGSESRHFVVLDLCTSQLPSADMVMVRECLIHLTFPMIYAALENLKKSGSTWLLTTTYPRTRHNFDIPVGRYRPINLTQYPFNLPKPVKLLREEYNPVRPDRERHMGLWRLADL